jgi:CubicO group peptidase (beta-lactamase class C family)
MRALVLVALLLSQTLAAQLFEGLSEVIDQGSFGDIKSVIISRHGKIIYEDYFRGSTAAELNQVQSVTKSIGSTLIGIAHRQGKITLDQDVVSSGGVFLQDDSTLLTEWGRGRFTGSCESY